MVKTKSAAERNGKIRKKSFFLIGLSVTLADQLLKLAVLSASGAGKLPFELLPGILKINYVTNTGIAFGFFQGNNLIMAFISLIAAAFLAVYGSRIKTESGMLAAAVMLGGTVGNLIDRILRGAVVDYVAVKGIPTFNLADAALTAGAALIIAGFITDNVRKKK